jgi:hypothetical protein
MLHGFANTTWQLPHLRPPLSFLALEMLYAFERLHAIAATRCYTVRAGSERVWRWRARVYKKKKKNIGY